MKNSKFRRTHMILNGIIVVMRLCLIAVCVLCLDYMRWLVTYRSGLIQPQLYLVLTLATVACVVLIGYTAYQIFEQIKRVVKGCWKRHKRN